MNSPRPRLSFVLVAMCAALLAGACTQPLGLPTASVENVVDTVSLWALSDTVISQPAAYQIVSPGVGSVPPRPVRTDRSSDFDFAFDVDSVGRLVLLPSGALGVGNGAGFDITTAAFDSIHSAPGSAYKADSAVFVDTGTVAIVRSRPTPCGAFSAVFIYAKMHVLAYDSTQHRLDFAILVDQNCGYRGLDPGLPRS